MVEIMVATIAASALVTSTYITARLSHKNKKDMAVSNGHKPGFMIEQTFNAMERIESKLDAHIGDDARHL